MNAKYKIDSRVHHDGICLTVTRVDYNEYLQQYQYVTRRTDGKKQPYFRAVSENELTSCNCKPKSTPAALPTAATLRVTSEPFGITEGDQVRVTRTRMLSYVQEVRGEDVMLAGGNWYHVDELTLIRKAPKKALCSVCEEYRTFVVTRDGVDICPECEALSRAPFKVGDTVRLKGRTVETTIKKVVPQRTGAFQRNVVIKYVVAAYGFNYLTAKDLEPVSPLTPAVITPKPRLEPLPGKFQRGQWVQTAHGKGRVLGLGAPNLYHVVVGSRRIIAREEYMQAAIPDWTLKSGDPSDYLAEKMAYEHALKTFPGTTPYIRVERDGFGIGYVTFGSGEKFYPMKQAWKAMKAHGADNPAVRLDVRGQIVQVRPYEEVAYGVATC